MKIKGIIKKEIIHIIRDKRTLYISFILPILLLIIFGYAIRTDLRNINVGIVDYDRKSLTREIINKLKNDKTFRNLKEEIEIYENLKKGKYHAFIIFPENFEKKLKRGEKTYVGIIFDASRNELAENLEGYLRQKIINFENENIKYKIIFNPELKSTYFIIPGIIVIIFMAISGILISISMTKEFENNSFEIYKISKISPFILYFGKIIPYIILGYLQLTLILLIGKILFKIPIKGNLFLLYFCSFFFLFVGFGIGILISTIFKDGRTTLMGVWLSCFLPSIFLSGFLFPIENMPIFLRILTYFVPARYFLYILRGIILKGLNFFDFINEFIALLIFSFFLLILSIIRIKREL
jgi:ABC-2 type transport system permease protein